jgi:hypothetical protein
MNFFDSTTTWIKGELFEASFILLFGISTILAGLLFWKLGSTPNAKALLLPVVVTGIIYSVIGGGMLYSNEQRMVAYVQSYQRDHSGFIRSEKKRVEDFQYGYIVSKIVATICFLTTLAIFWYIKSPVWQGVAIGLTYFALAGLVVDYFSSERAAVYYSAILKAIR